MVHLRLFASGIFAGLLLSASMLSCQPAASSNQNTETEEATSENEQSSDGAIREMGLIKSAEDAGYPFFSLEIEFPERQFSEFFILNMEEVEALDPQSLSQGVGKYAAFEYASEIENALLDLKIDGASIFPETEPLPETPETLKITGMLKKAEQATAGDLPDEVAIEVADGTVETFLFFITPEMVKANGKTVEATFEKRTVNTILSLEIKE